MTVWLAVRKPLVKTVHELHVMSFICSVFDPDADGSELADPHTCCVIRKVCISVFQGRGSNHARADGIISVHWKATVDGLLARLGIPLFIDLDGCILQATFLKKCGNGLANAS